MCEGGRSDVNSASERDIEDCVLAAVVVVRSLNSRIRMVTEWECMVTEWIVTEWVWGGVSCPDHFCARSRVLGRLLWYATAMRICSWHA